jgi:hypothetical protein
VLLIIISVKMDFTLEVELAAQEAVETVYKNFLHFY